MATNTPLPTFPLSTLVPLTGTDPINFELWYTTLRDFLAADNLLMFIEYEFPEPDWNEDVWLHECWRRGRAQAKFILSLTIRDPYVRSVLYARGWNSYEPSPKAVYDLIWDIWGREFAY